MLECEALQIFRPLLHFQTSEMFPFFPSFPVFLGKKKRGKIGKKSLNTNGPYLRPHFYQKYYARWYKTCTKLTKTMVEWETWPLELVGLVSSVVQVINKTYPRDTKSGANNKLVTNFDTTVLLQYGKEYMKLFGRTAQVRSTKSSTIKWLTDNSRVTSGTSWGRRRSQSQNH